MRIKILIKQVGWVLGLCVITLILTLTLTTQSYAEPTKEETIDFILDKFDGDCYANNYSGNADSTVKSAIKISEGTLIFSTESTTIFSGVLAFMGIRIQNRIQEVMLKDLDPRISFEHFYSESNDTNCMLLKFECSKNECIQQSSSVSLKESKTHSNYATKNGELFMGSDIKDAERIVKALSHLIIQSGGKEQLF
jgi:hypothetical protein